MLTLMMAEALACLKGCQQLMAFASSSAHMCSHGNADATTSWWTTGLSACH